MIVMACLMGVMTMGALAFVLWPIWKRHRFIALTLLIALPGVATLLYFHWGASDQLSHYWVLKTQAQAVESELADINTSDEVIEKLLAHLKQDPNSAKGWYLLGRLYLDTGRYEESEKAMFKAHRLKPDSDPYTVAYAQAWFFNHNQRLSPGLRAAVHDVLNRSSNNSAAINLLALDAYQQKQYSKAIAYWEGLIPQFPAGSRDRTVLLKMISQAQEKMQGDLDGKGNNTL